MRLDMDRIEGTFSSRDNQAIFYQGWLPEGQLQGALLVIHGLHEHSGRYQHLGKYFADKGYAVYGLDFLGHGKSDGVRSFINSFDDFTLNLLAFVEMVRGWHPDVPVFLMGHSLGGLIASVFLLDHQELAQGAVLSGPLVKVPAYVTPLTIKIGQLLSSWLPKFRILAIDIEGISQDPAVVQSYRTDPLVFTGKMTARISGEMNKAITRLAEQGSAIQVPLLLLHGSLDRLCDPAWSAYLRDLVSSPDKQMIIYEGFYHEVYNEPGQEQVFQDVLAWLHSHAA